MPFEHRYALFHGHGDLFLANGDHATRQVLVVLLQQVDGDEDVVNVVEDEGILLGVFGLALEESRGVVAPVSKRVQVMRGVVTIVVTEPIALE